MEAGFVLATGDFGKVLGEERGLVGEIVFDDEVSALGVVLRGTSS